MTELTRHAHHRAQQRGVTAAMIEALIAWADLEIPAGDGCTVLRFSRERLRDRDLRAALGPTADRLGSVVVVMAPDCQAVVTVLHARAGAAGRRYRRPN